MTKDHAYLYLSSISEAKRQNEVALWRASHLENIACKQAIEEAIRRGFDGMHLSHDCARGVIEDFGFKRVGWVLAATIQLKPEDARFSRRNKEWAKTVPNFNSDSVRRDYALNTHPAVLDGFIDLVREEQQRGRAKAGKAQQPRTSVREKLRQEPPARKPASPKKREPER